MRIVASAALMTLLTGCTGPAAINAGADVVGNELGGKLSYAEGQMPAAMSAAQAHCAKFGKKAQVTRLVPGSQGGEIGFECR
jgi:hypothetical protein